MVVDKIINSAVGCTECCPFCFSPCLLTIKDHNEDHESDNHMFEGIRGTIMSGTGKLFNHKNCNLNVSNRELRIRFRSANNGEYFYYADYKKYFPKW